MRMGGLGFLRGFFDFFGRVIMVCEGYIPSKRSRKAKAQEWVF